VVNYLQAQDILDHKTTETPHFRSASGYGRKIPTCHLVQLKDGKWRRIYVFCFSNSGTAYILVKGEWLVIGPEAEAVIRPD
jgi:hypothetical protein